jgi:acetyltransferase-like isoleucine patch superfamily enzyme
VWAFAHVLEGAVVGAGCNICDHAFIETGARIGNNVTVKNGVQLWDKVVVEDDVFIGPNASFTNDLRPRAFMKKSPEELMSTLVGRGATIGANATIVCGITGGGRGGDRGCARACARGGQPREIAWMGLHMCSAAARRPRVSSLRARLRAQG